MKEMNKYLKKIERDNHYDDYSLNEIKLLIKRSHKDSLRSDLSNTFATHNRVYMKYLYSIYKKRGGKLSIVKIVKGGK